MGTKLQEPYALAEQAGSHHSDAHALADSSSAARMGVRQSSQVVVLAASQHPGFEVEMASRSSTARSWRSWISRV